MPGYENEQQNRRHAADMNEIAWSTGWGPPSSNASDVRRQNVVLA
jgi:hypothetical protein